MRCSLLSGAVALTLGLFASVCAHATDWSTHDLKTNAPLPSGVVTINNVTVQWQVGNYWSDKLRIYGLLCNPAPVFAPLPHPVAILNHGLEPVKFGVDPNGNPNYVFPAIEQTGFTGCVNMAASGWTVAISTYRGEIIGSAFAGLGLPAPYQTWWAVSDGAVELCEGEVDDVLNLLTDVSKLSVSIPSRVYMWGHSHGSCITERALERGAQVEIAVSIDGPTDFTTWPDSPPLTLLQKKERSTALNDPGLLAKHNFLRVQAEEDLTVPPSQACELVKQVPGSQNYYLYAGVSPPGSYALPPPSCAPWPMTWKLGQLPPDEIPGASWASPTFLMYNDLNPTLTFPAHVKILPASWNEVRSFVNQYAAGWGATIPATFFWLEN